MRIVRLSRTGCSFLSTQFTAQMESPSAMAFPAATVLPTCWTSTDQCIMEHLLLDQPDVENPQSLISSRTVEVSRNTSEEKEPKQKQSSTRHNSDAVKGAGSDKRNEMEEDRRARHRAVQRRFIQRKKAEVERTKALVQTLEKRYHYLQIAANERDLKRENRKLRARVNNAAASLPRVPHVDPVQLSMQNQLELVREFYEPLSLHEVVSLQQKAQLEYTLSQRDNTFQTSGASVMGWSDFRKVEKSSVKFVLSKGFPNVRAFDLMNVAWDSFTSPTTYARFFGPAFPIKMQVVQSIGRDAVIVHRVLFNPRTQSSSNALELLWRVRLGEEYVIFDSALQHNAVQQCLGASYKWTQLTTSLGFTALDVDQNSGCILRYGGLIRTSVTNTEYWYMEMFFMALRFESLLVAPVFALRSEE